MSDVRIVNRFEGSGYKISYDGKSFMLESCNFPDTVNIVLRDGDYIMDESDNLTGGIMKDPSVLSILVKMHDGYFMDYTKEDVTTNPAIGTKYFFGDGVEIKVSGSLYIIFKDGKEVTKLKFLNKEGLFNARISDFEGINTVDNFYSLFDLVVVTSSEDGSMQNEVIENKDLCNSVANVAMTEAKYQKEYSEFIQKHEELFFEDYYEEEW
jgi:hypothetical protein